MSEIQGNIVPRIFPGLRADPGGRRGQMVIVGLFFLLISVMLLSADKGVVELTQSQIAAIILKIFGLHPSVEFTQLQESTLLDIRLPRVVLGALVGAALGISGAAMQGLFRNPLADPSIVGISSGAALAATVVVVVGDIISVSIPPGAQLLAFPIAAFVGATATTLIIYRLSTIGGRTVVATLLLAGIAINALAQAISGFLIFFATDTQIRSLTFWKLGSMGGANWNSVLAISPFILIPIVLFITISRPLNVLLLGEQEAGHLGFDIEKIKKLTIVLVALSVGASVAFTGLITFVGLVVRMVCV